MDLDLYMPISVGQSASVGDWLVEPGHAYVGLRAGGRNGRRVARGGLGVTLPFGMLSDRPHEASHLRGGGLLALGRWDPWQFASERVTIVARGDVAYESTWFFVGGESAFAVAIVLRPAHEDSLATEQIFQLAAWVGARLGPVDVGLRAAFVVATGFGALDGYAVPFVRLRTGWLSVEARAPLTLAQDRAQALQILLTGHLP